MLVVLPHVRSSPPWSWRPIKLLWRAPIILLLCPQVAWAQCADPAELIASAENDIISFFLVDAEISLDEAVEAYACAPLAQPAELARLWQARGVIRLLQDEDATLELAASRALAPEVWNEDYGEKSHALWLTAKSDDQGTVRFKGLPKGHWIAVDGRTFNPKRLLSTGPHLFQIVDDEQPYYARAVNLAADAQIYVTIPTDRSAPVVVETLPQGSEGVSRPLLVVGGAGVALGSILYGLAKGQDASMKNAQDLSTLDAAYKRQQVLGYSGYVLAAGGAVSIGLAVAL